MIAFFIACNLGPTGSWKLEVGSWKLTKRWLTSSSTFSRPCAINTKVNIEVTIVVIEQMLNLVVTATGSCDAH